MLKGVTSTDMHLYLPDKVDFLMTAELGENVLDK